MKWPSRDRSNHEGDLLCKHITQKYSKYIKLSWSLTTQGKPRLNIDRMIKQTAYSIGINRNFNESGDSFVRILKKDKRVNIKIYYGTLCKD